VNNSTLIVLEAVNSGRPVPKRDLDAAIRTLEDMLAEAQERGTPRYVSRIQESIERIRQYKKVRGIKPRSFEEIQQDIDSAQLMINEYRMKRRYELAARWERNRDEYQKEYKEATAGRPYIPKVEEADENAAREWIPDGFQICL
jgi:hypothetical protein